MGRFELIGAESTDALVNALIDNYLDGFNVGRQQGRD